MNENYLTGKLFKKSGQLEMGIPYFEMAAKDGHLEAMYEFGRFIAKTDEPSSVKWFRMAAEQGHHRSQKMMVELYSSYRKFGSKYFKKITIKQIPDDKESIKWLRKLVKKGSSYGKMGEKYERGLGVKKDISKAIYWYKKSTNCSTSYLRLGRIHLELEKFKDTKLAFESLLNYLKCLREESHKYPENQIVADMYFYGYGTKQNYKEARKLYLDNEKYRDGIEKENSRYNLGLIYFYGGHGVKKNHKEAKKWFKKTSYEKYLESLMYLDKIKMV